ARAVKAGRETDDAAIHDIAHHFSRGSLEEVVASLDAGARENDEFASAALETIRKRSPTSLHVTFRQITAGAMLDMDECMRMEFRILSRMLEGHDFYEGIRAVIIEKGSTPQWRPDTLEAVPSEEVERYFAPLGE